MAISRGGSENYCNYSAGRLKLLIISFIGGAEAAYDLLLCDNVGPKTLMISLHKLTFGPDTLSDTRNAAGEDPARRNSHKHTFGTLTDVLLVEFVCLLTQKEANKEFDLAHQDGSHHCTLYFWQQETRHRYASAVEPK